MAYAKSFREIVAWERGIELSVACIHLAARLPAVHRFGLADQLCRAAVSVSSNIAEGFGRFGAKSFANHCSIANGSLCEVETDIEIALRSKLLPEADCRNALTQVNSVGLVLLPLIKSLRRSRE